MNYLGMSTATDEEMDIIARYTKRQPCIVENAPDAQTVWLVVGGQSFCINTIPCDTIEEANWTRHMLAKALLKIVHQAKHDATENMRKWCIQLAKEWAYSSKPDHALGIADAISRMDVNGGVEK